MTAMAVNKVIYGTTVLVDLTGDTVNADNLASGYTAHDKAGNPITGTMAVSSMYTGSDEPSSSIGDDGDLYIKL